MKNPEIAHCSLLICHLTRRGRVRFVGRQHLQKSDVSWDHESFTIALPPSPSPIRWERVAARPGEGKPALGFMGSRHLRDADVSWDREPFSIALTPSPSP